MKMMAMAIAHSTTEVVKNASISLFEHIQFHYVGLLFQPLFLNNIKHTSKYFRRTGLFKNIFKQGYIYDIPRALMIFTTMVLIRW